jgi:hypothetical protein
MICDREILEARWKFALPEDDFAGVENMVTGTGEIREIANGEW